MEDQEAVELAERDNGMHDAGYNERFTAMELAIRYTGGRSVGWPNLKKLADDIGRYLKTGQ